MITLLSVVGTIAIFAINGLPLALFGNAKDLTRRLLVAPVLGASLLVVLVTILYRFGVAPGPGVMIVTASMAVLAAAIMVRASREVRLAALSKISRWDLAFYAACFGGALITITLPHWVGGEQFAIYQGNKFDNINYITMGVGYANYPYSFLKDFAEHPSSPIASLAFAGNLLTQRPGVAILYAGLYKTLSVDFIAYAYDYGLALQMCLLLAFGSLATYVFPTRAWVAMILAVGFTVGFFGQYLFDLNAWSELLSVPFAVVLVIQFSTMLAKLLSIPPTLAMAGPESVSDSPQDQAHLEIWGTGCRVLVLASGIVYAYPEISPVAAIACAAASAMALFVTVRRKSLETGIKIVKFGIIAVAATLAVAVPAWDQTVLHMLNQLEFGRSAAPDWYLYFLAYMIGSSPNNFAQLSMLPAWSADHLAIVLTTATDIGTGLAGLYFIQPPADWPPSIRIAYQLALLTGLAYLLYASVRAAVALFTRHLLSEESTLLGRMIIVAGLCTFVIPGYLVVVGQYWSFGKALSMVSPFVFLLLTMPALAALPGRISVALCWCLVMAQVVFGFYRPVSLWASGDGSYYSPPYPTMTDANKVQYDWNIAQYTRDLLQCKLVRVDVDEPFAERIAQNFLIDKGIQWYSPRSQDTAYGYGAKLGPFPSPGDQREDCQITTVFPFLVSVDKAIWLRKDKGLVEFLLGKRSTFDVCCPIEAVRMEGIGPKEGDTAWTTNRLIIRLPGLREWPLKKIGFEFGEFWSAQQRDYTIAVNQIELYRSKGDRNQRSVEIELPSNLDRKAEITVELSTETFRVPSDPRDLGAQIRRIYLQR